MRGSDLIHLLLGPSFETEGSLPGYRIRRFLLAIVALILSGFLLFVAITVLVLVLIRISILVFRVLIIRIVLIVRIFFLRAWLYGSARALSVEAWSKSSRHTCRGFRLISTRGWTATPSADFFSAPPASADPALDGRAADGVGALAEVEVGRAGEAVRAGGDVDLDGPASGTLSLSESDESNSEDDPSG